MDKPWFTLELKPEVARTMSRDQWYAARSWMRLVASEIRKAEVFTKNMKEMNNGHVYGYPPSLSMGMGLLELKVAQIRLHYGLQQ